MCMAIIFCDEPQQKRYQNENHHSLLRRSENESLPELIEFKALAFFQFQSDLITDRH